MKGNLSLRFVLILLIVAFLGWFGWRNFVSEPSPTADLATTSTKTEPAAPTAVLTSTSVSSTQRPQVKGNDEDGPSVSIVSDRPRYLAEASPAQRKAAENDVDLRNAATSLRDYRKAFNQNPVGTNAEITRALLGKNSQHSKYLAASAHLNSGNELTDRWDQPLFFHQIAANKMEIRSAGPDRKMWTADDEVLR